jgi:hypothetical protein
MFKEPPLHWIVEAEAREMLIHALSEATAPMGARGDAGEPMTWFERLRRLVQPGWFSAWSPDQCR